MLSMLVVGSILVDLIGISNRYLDSELFINEDQTYFTKNQADMEILDDTSDYRVYDATQGLNGANTSFFHNSVGGYHAAKLRRFQEVYDYFRFHNKDLSLLNMLNTKYILSDSETGKELYTNEDALGNVWAVDSISLVDSADEILNKLKEIDIEWLDKKSLCVVLCSKGYPDDYKKNEEIPNLDNIKISNSEYL